MRVYKATYKDRSGQRRKSAKWYFDFADYNQLRYKTRDSLRPKQ